jgi:hypothetical protein
MEGPRSEVAQGLSSRQRLVPALDKAIVEIPVLYKVGLRLLVLINACDMESSNVWSSINRLICVMRTCSYQAYVALVALRISISLLVFLLPPIIAAVVIVDTNAYKSTRHLVGRHETQELSTWSSLPAKINVQCTVQYLFQDIWLPRLIPYSEFKSELPLHANISQSEISKRVCTVRYLL